MRKAQKKGILEIIKTLYEAHDEIKNYIDKKNYSLAQDMLGQCQECAISIGTAIESLEGEGFVTVSYVETYCDVVFSIYEELNSTDVNGNKVYKKLKKQLLHIENSVKNDVPVRKEIAFFPYKASMWDALESIYMEAKKDPSCDVYCVPIPYYDRNPDRSFGEMHYEGREYPKNIEVIDWQTYNFEERKPDVIYIHNPYDDWNLVTSVHPRYYSANLKKNTEKLVYIPYFVLDEIEPNDQTRIDGMKHFCFLPGIINADNVIVQSEKMKQIYVNEYMKAAKSHGFLGEHIDRKKMEEKFLGLGSPKFDKVLNTKKEELEIPAEWLKIIQKPDGSWKKIIFYNTSIAALLENNEKMLEKMKYVFRVFKENQDEIALLWRPHPLIKSTVSSMKPQLWLEYEKIVNQYCREGWGIYDDSADMDRAVVLSDAYYGDASSVVYLYQQTGKPVMIQNMNILEFKDEELLFGCGIAFQTTEMWMPLAMINAFVHIDVLSGDMDCCGQFGEVYLDQDNHTNLYTDVVEIGEKLYFAPTRANAIAIFNKKERELKTKKLDIPCEFNRKVSNYAIGLKDGKDIYFIGACQTNAIVKLNSESGQIKYYGWNIANNQSMAKKNVYGMNVVVVDRKLYVPLLTNGELYTLDLETDEEQILRIDNQGRKLVTINYRDGFFYITTQEGTLLRWQNGRIEEMKLPTCDECYSSFCTGEYLWLFPRNPKECIVKIDLEKESTERIEFPYVVYDVKEDSQNLILNTRGGYARLNINTNDIERISYKTKEKKTLRQIVEQWNDKTDSKIGKYEGCPEYNTVREYVNIIIGDKLCE